MAYLNYYPFSPIFTHFHLLAIWVELRRIDATVSSLHQECQKLSKAVRWTQEPYSYNFCTNHAPAFTLHHVL